MEQQSLFDLIPIRPRLPTLIGYSLSAYHESTGWMSTYRESPTLEIALKLCAEEFPSKEGWINLTVEKTLQ